MLLFPAIDLYAGKAVRLYKGRYDDMTVYSENPPEVARDFVRAGATHVHLVDLEGARSGATPNLPLVREIAQTTPLFTEIGGGIRNMATVRAYLEAGVDRVILGTAAVTDEAFLREALECCGEKISVGVDIRDGMVAVKGWEESSSFTADAFLERLVGYGVTHIICTNISKDGAMQGTDLPLYERLSREYPLKITASGGVSSLEDIRSLRAMGLYGAIVGKAYYTGALDLATAIQEAK